MNCPKCGSYSKYRFKTKKEKKKPREDFSTKCKACGFEGIEKPFGQSITTEEISRKVFETKIMGYQIRCKLDGSEKIKDATCKEFKPINPHEKARCYNCQNAEEI